MVNKTVILLLVFCGLLMAGISYITARFIDQEEINRVKMEMVHLEAVRDSITTVVAKIDLEKKQLQGQVENLNLQANVLRDSVLSLEESRQEEQLRVRQLSTKQDLERDFIKTYPEVAYSMRIIEIDEDGLPLEYLSVPLWFTEAFIIDHQNAASYEEQRDKLLEVDTLRTKVSALQDSVLLLEEEKSAAYKQGYDEAYARYEALNKDYLDCLEKPPQVKFGFPKAGLLIGAAAAGLGAGVYINK